MNRRLVLVDSNDPSSPNRLRGLARRTPVVYLQNYHLGRVVWDGTFEAISKQLQILEATVATRADVARILGKESP